MLVHLAQEDALLRTAYGKTHLMCQFLQALTLRSLPGHVILMAVVGGVAPGKEPWENIMERSDAKCKATELYFKGSALRGRSDSAKFGKPFRSFKADRGRERV